MEYSKVVYISLESRTKSILVSSLRASKLIQMGCTAFLAFVTVIFTEATEIKLEDIHIIWDYPDVFPEELPGIPPEREVSFSIDLIPGAEPVSKAPYRISPTELKELKE